VNNAEIIMKLAQAVTEFPEQLTSIEVSQTAEGTMFAAELTREGANWIRNPFWITLVVDMETVPSSVVDVTITHTIDGAKRSLENWRALEDAISDAMDPNWLDIAFNEYWPSDANDPGWGATRVTFRANGVAREFIWNGPESLDAFKAYCAGRS
jgi:hypothetical protein